MAGASRPSPPRSYHGPLDPSMPNSELVAVSASLTEELRELEAVTAAKVQDCCRRVEEMASDIRLRESGSLLRVSKHKLSQARARVKLLEVPPAKFTPVQQASRNHLVTVAGTSDSRDERVVLCALAVSKKALSELGPAGRAALAQYVDLHADNLMSSRLTEFVRRNHPRSPRMQERPAIGGPIAAQELCGKVKWRANRFHAGESVNEGHLFQRAIHAIQAISSLPVASVDKRYAAFLRDVRDGASIEMLVLVAVGLGKKCIVDTNDNVRAHIARYMANNEPVLRSALLTELVVDLNARRAPQSMLAPSVSATAAPPLCQAVYRPRSEDIACVVLNGGLHDFRLTVPSDPALAPFFTAHVGPGMLPALVARGCLDNSLSTDVGTGIGQNIVAGLGAQ